MKQIATLSILSLTALTACGGSGSTPPVATVAGVSAATATLPITATGAMVAVELPANLTSRTFQGTTSYSATPTSAVATDRTGASGSALSITADEDTSRTRPVGTAVQAPALIDVTAGNLQGGRAITPVTDAAGTVYFENGNFGDPQLSSSPSIGVSGVSVYNPSSGGQIVLKDVSTMRVTAFNQGDTNAVYGVGYVGNATTNMPNANSVTYRSFFEGGTSGYDDGGTYRRAYLGVPGASGAPSVTLTADFGASVMSADVNGAQLRGSNGSGAFDAVLNSQVDGLTFSAPIVGSTYLTGNAQLVDASNNPVGTQVSSQLVGGFFGDNAAETALGLVIQGNMAIDNGTATANRDYVYSTVIAGVRQ